MPRIPAACILFQLHSGVAVAHTFSTGMYINYLWRKKLFVVQYYNHLRVKAAAQLHRYPVNEGFDFSVIISLFITKLI